MNMQVFFEELKKDNDEIKEIILRIEKYYCNKQERFLEEQHIKLQRELMEESSRHYLTRNKLERAELARLDTENALAKEKKAHERTKKELDTDIDSLKHELEVRN